MLTRGREWDGVTRDTRQRVVGIANYTHRHCREHLPLAFPECSTGTEYPCLSHAIL